MNRKLTLTQVGVMTGCQDDATNLPVTLLYANISSWKEADSSHAWLVGILDRGILRPLPGCHIFIEREGDNVSYFLDDGEEFPNGCPFCGGTIHIPRGHSFGVCEQCGSI